VATAAVVTGEIGFGIGIVFRFFLLAYDAEAFASPSTTLANRPPAVVNLALASAGVFWICFVTAALEMREIAVNGPVVGAGAPPGAPPRPPAPGRPPRPPAPRPPPAAAASVAICVLSSVIVSP